MEIRTSVNEERHIDRLNKLLKKAFVYILIGAPVDSHEELYRNAYSMVLHKSGEMLYNNIKETITNHLKEITLPQVLDPINTDKFLTTLLECWNNFTASLIQIRDVCMNLERVYIGQQRRDLPNIYNLGIQLFRDNIIIVETIKNKLKESIIDEIEMSLKTEKMEWNNLKSICKMLLILCLGNRGFYENTFEEIFLQNSTEYYRIIYEEYLADKNLKNFVQKTFKFIKKEEENAACFLDEITRTKLLAILNDELIGNHLHEIINMENDGLVFMLENNCIEDLKDLHELFDRVPNGSDVIIEASKKYFQDHKTVEVNEVMIYMQNLRLLFSKFV